MRKLLVLIVFVWLSHSAFAQSAVAKTNGRLRVQEGAAKSGAPRIGYIKNEDLVDMCGCAFEHRTASRGYTFSSDRQTAWMNIDGEDVKLRFVRAAGPRRARIGRRFVEWYEGEGIKVTLVEVVSRVCIPYGPDCETTGYNVTITVSKGGRSRSVKARGQCGCV